MKKPIIVKNKKILVFAVLICIIFSVNRLFHNAAITRVNSGKEAHVSKVIDGDTVELSNGEIVRYIGIDTPEIRQRKGKDWIYDPRPFSEAAKEFNRKLVEGRIVRLEFDVQKRDRYSRILAYVYTDGIMVNMEILKEGYAMIYTYPPNVKYAKDFLSAQEIARDNNKGLWGRMDEGIISSSEALENMGFIRIVETEVLSTFISEDVLVLNCRDGFKIAIFRNNLSYFPTVVARSPETYFKHKKIRAYGLIKDYKGSPELIIRHPSQLESVE